MATDHLIFLSVPGLRPSDIGKETAPTLDQWAHQGALAELSPTFPCVTSPVQATMWTGLPPEKHGVIANGFFDRDRREVEFWVAHNRVITGEQIWGALRAKQPDFTSAVWHAQNIKGAAADFIVTPAPIHQEDGTTKLWCYSKPEGLYPQLLEAFGHFPLQHYWGPLAGIESTRWIFNAAGWLIREHAPNLNWVYVPHLDYAAQRHGPNSPEAKTALGELDRALGEFALQVDRSAIGGHVVFLVAGEYALTDVTGVIHPNRILREAGLLTVRDQGQAEYIDLAHSSAFAMVDHQFAHVFINRGDPHAGTRVVEAMQSVPGIAGIFVGNQRGQVGMNHQRSGEIILVCDDAHWLAYYWWLDDAAAPPFARTVDIHRKPGYDPVELFLDPASSTIPLNAELVKGSHGAPATRPHSRTALICSTRSNAVESGRIYRDTDVKRITLELLGL